MAMTGSDGERIDALLKRVGEPGGILDADALLQQAAGRLIAQAIMCNPAYVLTIEERESLIGSPPDPGAAK